MVVAAGIDDKCVEWCCGFVFRDSSWEQALILKRDHIVAQLVRFLELFLIHVHGTVSQYRDPIDRGSEAIALRSTAPQCSMDILTIRAWPKAPSGVRRPGVYKTTLSRIPIGRVSAPF